MMTDRELYNPIDKGEMIMAGSNETPVAPGAVVMVLVVLFVLLLTATLYAIALPS